MKKKPTPTPRGRKGGRKTKHPDGVKLVQRSVRLLPSVWAMIDDQTDGAGDYITRLVTSPHSLSESGPFRLPPPMQPDSTALTHIYACQKVNGRFYFNFISPSVDDLDKNNLQKQKLKNSIE